ncbi:granulin b [Cololabis saira]|uniref:granulin b n=1 Tax=Cololabis saira TaxID=129043 RepID=UPI002AD3E93A|nr:granulin b [Cololabis saira]
MSLQMEFLCLVLLGLSTALICPDGGMCEDKNTCCKNNEGAYGCCPLPHAECCSDHLHCCYEGTVCDLIHQKCVNETISLPWMKRLAPELAPQVSKLVGRAKAVICPDQESECPDDTTCCQLPDGSWGCCPFPKAVCCEDKRHCCPEGTSCDVAHSKCVPPSLQSFPMLKKMPARRNENQPASATGSVACPGGNISCPDTFTCCQLTSGDYGCCPYQNATCCSDRLHCCPSKSICDLKYQRCKSVDTQLQLMRTIPADTVCPDGKSRCPDQTTCCQLSNGTYGCCPLPNAVCCEDHLHCCPSGTTCNVAAATCDDLSGSAMMPLIATMSILPFLEENSKCDESTSCPGKATCCKTASGSWGCCPLPEAVCCSDHIHCCPAGTECDLFHSICSSAQGSFPMSVKMLAVVTEQLAVQSKVQNVPCNDSVACADGNTCCKTSQGRWACCPLPKAVCCKDHLHCCPHGTVCNLEAETCDDPSGSVPALRWLTKIPALALPQKLGELSLPWLQKIPALQKETNQGVSGQSWPAQNMCDHQASCPRDTTCCFMEQSHQWGCCPLPKGVCCKDGNHCCPSGHTCEPQRSSCSRGSRVIPWFTKLSARTLAASVADVKCDDKSSCASGTTCCKLQTGEWGCCPLVKAVCCADHEHCCPQGYTCNMQTKTCEKKMHAWPLAPLPLSEVVRSEPRDGADGEDVPCDGTGEFSCPKHHTCCKVSATEWACCSSPQAVCCADSRHCCPPAHLCDMKTGGCTPRSQLTWDALLSNRERDSVLRGL